MTLSNRAYRIATAALLLLTLVNLTGCTAFFGRERTSMSGLDTRPMEAAGYTFGPQGAQIASPQNSDRPTVILEVQNGKQHMERIPLPPEHPMLVEDVIRDAKLIERLGPIDVTILRPVSPNHPPVRMDVGFDSRGQKVMVEQNYTLNPGDKIVVVPANRDWGSKIVGSLMPFANTKR